MFEKKKQISSYLYCVGDVALPELFGECWLPLDAVLGGGGPGGLPLFLGLPGGNVSVIDIKLAIGLCNVCGTGGVESPSDTGGSCIVVG